MDNDAIRQDDILYSPQLVQQERGGIHLLIDPESPNWATTNAFGSMIIRRCDGKHTFAEIADDVSNYYGCSASKVRKFILQAVNVGFITNRPNLSPSYQGRASAIAPYKLEELWINTNNSCPLRCKHCLVNGGIEKNPPLSAFEIKELVGEAIELGVKRIYFTGGEPFFRKDISALIEYVTSKTKLVILTSGVLITENLAEHLNKVANGNLLIQISLEGANPETNDAIRGKGNFALAVRGIKNLIKSGLTPIVTTTITRLNSAEAPATTRFLASIGVKNHHILWLHPRGRMRANFSDLTVDGAHVAEVMKNLNKTVKPQNIFIDNFHAMAARIRGPRGRKNDLCNSGYGILNVDTDGRVYPCAALCGAESFNCGSTREKSLQEIWLKSHTAKRVRENSVQKRAGCSCCSLKFFCGGGCYAQSYFNHETITGEGCLMAADPYCEAYKSLITELMWEMATPDAKTTGNTPVFYKHMGNNLSECAVDGNRITDAAFNVGTYRCSCVLAMDAALKKIKADG